MNYFLYRHIRLDKNEPFYIGIGKKLNKYASWGQEYKRAFSKSRNNLWNKVVAKTDYKVEILFECNDEQEIKSKEIEFIKLYGRIDLGTGSLSNLCDGGIGTLNPSKETINKIIESGKWYKHSEETKRKISNSKKGKSININDDAKLKRKLNPYSHSEESKLKIGKAHKGRKLSQEQIEKIRISKLGVKQSKESILKTSKANKKSILQYDKNKNFIAEYNSTKEASELLGINKSTILRSLKQKFKNPKGFIWKYKII